MECFAILVYIFSSVSIVFRAGFAATDSISGNGSIVDGQKMVSAGGSFELGFFSPGEGNDNRYVGIWYQKSPQRVVWVANPENPLNDSSGVLKLTSEGVLTLLNRADGVLWSDNVSKPAQNPTAQLLDSGNFVVTDGNDNSLIWQSFDHPRNSLLAGMKFGIDKEKGLDRYLTSWRSVNDPSPGDFTYRLDPSGYPQIIMRNGSVVVFRSGPWNGLQFPGFPQMRTNNPVFSFRLVFNQSEIYYSFQNLDSLVPSILVLTKKGIIRRLNWEERTHDWIPYSATQTDDCDHYALCGGNGNCSIASNPKCECLWGFVPKNESDWKIGDWSNGCVRRTALDCQGGGDQFFRYTNAKLPDTRQSWFNMSMNLQECKEICLRNCSCTAYSNTNITGGGSGCLLWFGALMDIRVLNENDQDFYVRLAASEIGTHPNHVYQGDSLSGNSKKSMKIIVSCVLSAALLSVALVCRKYQRDRRISGFFGRGQCEDLELPIFYFSTIMSATNNFSVGNKIGQGGFGAVYKGVLRNRQEIAVKRLSENSMQGLLEFKSEVMYIAKLQHQNLIKLLECCIEKNEKMLIYEFMPNKSLDCFIFDQEEGTLLGWPKRIAIINGIASGLLYLHRDSRLRIIHRDLKAENILLDKEMNPKISDFGLARSFRGSESESSTVRVVGTYGYMSPEYALHGFYSVKSDVFSFGVLVLEISHGRRNRGYHHPGNNLNLLGHAWILFKESQPLELIHPSIAGTCNHLEVLRSIHVALLCVQQNPEDRPEMSSVAMMLGSENALPQPKQPGFFSEEGTSEARPSSCSKHPIFSVNDLTISQLMPR